MLGRLLFLGWLLVVPFAALTQAEFVRNKGQWPDQVAFRAEIPAGVLWAESNSFTWLFYDPIVLEYLHPVSGPIPGPHQYRQHVYKMNFLGSNIPVISPRKMKSHYFNYYLGDDPAAWVEGAGVSEMADYSELYDGIDLQLYSKNNAVKYDFIVKPGADPGIIQLEFEGASGLELKDGNWEITTSVNKIVEKAPFAYQIIQGKMKEIPCAYVRDGNNLSFELGQYDPAYELIIDPEIAFATYIGSTASNFGFTACNDSQGNLISGAAVFAQGYPTTVGAYDTDFDTGFGNYMDIAVSKFSPDGSQLLYSTYLGGSKQETGHSVVADGNDNFILFGVTGSLNFPSTTGVYQEVFDGGPLLSMQNFFTSGHPDGTDIFISKFSSAGALTASTFVGAGFNDGLNYSDKLFYNYGDAFRGEVNVDDNNNIFVASVTNGTFPTTADATQLVYGGGECDGVLLKMNPSLTTLMWSTYIGGGDNDACYAIEFAEDGTILVAGGTKSDNFPHCSNGIDNTHNGDADGFILKIDPVTMDVVNGTFVGTSEYDQVYFVQFDALDNIYALGQTEGDMGISAGLYGQPNSGQFIRKYSPDLNLLLWNTTVGTGSGEVDISPTAFLVSDCYQIYFSGWGGETNGYCGDFYTCYASSSTTNGLPVTSDAYQQSTDGSDFYLCVLSPDATELVYASYLGGGVSNEHVDGGTSRFDKDGSVYQAVCAGCGANSDFPTTAGAWSAVNPSTNCNIAVFKFNLGGVNALLNIDGPNIICEGTPAQFINNSSGATDFIWDFGDESTSTAEEPIHEYTAPGEYTITLVATDDTGCLDPDTASMIIEVIQGVNPSIEPEEPLCPGEVAQLSASGTAALFWLDNPTLSATDIPNPTASPTVTTTYFAVDSNDCETDTVGVIVEVVVPVTGISDDTEICLGQSTTLEATGGVEYFWFPNNSLSDPDEAITEASPNDTTLYTCSIITADGCEVNESVTVGVVFDPPGGNHYDDISMCNGGSALLLALPGLSYVWSPSSTLSNALAQSPFAFPSDTTTYTVDITNACGMGTDTVTVNVITPHAEAFGGGTICLGNWIQAWATGGVDYFWQPVNYCSEPFEDTTLLSPPETMYITVVVTDEYGCADMDSVSVFVMPLPEVDAGPDQYINYLESTQLFGNSNWDNFYWSPGENLSCTDCFSPWVYPDSSGYYYLTVTDHNGCMAVDSVLVQLYFPLWVPNTITANNDGLNDYFRAYGDNITGFHMQIFDRWGLKVFESWNIEEVWDGGIDGYYVQNDAYLWIIWYDTVDRKAQLMGHVNVVR